MQKVVNMSLYPLRYKAAAPCTFIIKLLVFDMLKTRYPSPVINDILKTY